MIKMKYIVYILMKLDRDEHYKILNIDNNKNKVNVLNN